jgi:RNA polymerase sigma factor (sigma-70 family)
MKAMERDRAVSGGTTTGLAGRAARDAGASHAALFERIVERVYRYFRKTVRDPAEAEDCAQKTLLELERTLRERRYEAGRSFNTWIFMKAHQVFVDWCRARGRRLEPLADADAGPAPGGAAGDAVERVDERLDAAAVLAEVERRLGTEAYECFVLRYQGGLTLDAVAETVGRDRRTVAGRIRAAHALIDRLLGQGGRA